MEMTQTVPAPFIPETRSDKQPQGKKLPAMVLIVYCALFYGTWTLFELFIKPLINSLDAHPALIQLLKSGVIKNLVWTIPALLLVRKYSDSVNVGLKEMFASKVDMRLTTTVFLLCTALLLVPKYVRGGGLALSEDFTICTAIGYLFVGITEESVFRGWLLNVTVGSDTGDVISKRRTWLLMLLNGVMFVCIHIPVWSTTGKLGESFASFGFLSIIAVGMIFGWLFLRTRNLLVPVVLHMYYDILIDLFV